MSEQGERYDRIVEGYERHWGPIIEPAALRLLDRVAPVVATGPTRILDVGTGTGALAIEAVRRWPQVSVDAIDPSGEMLAAAARRAAHTLDSSAVARLTFATASAEGLPFEDGRFDLVVSSFVLQLVPNRFRALREAWRVLRPGGTLAYVTWLLATVDFAPDRVLDEVLDAYGYGPREADGRSGDVPSPSAAIGQLRRAGFGAATATTDEVVHRFDPAGYLAFVAEFDEDDLFSELDRKTRREVEGRLLAGLRALPPDALVLRLPVVYASARRSATRSTPSPPRRRAPATDAT